MHRPVGKDAVDSIRVGRAKVKNVEASERSIRVVVEISGQGSKALGIRIRDGLKTRRAHDVGIEAVRPAAIV
ncbi:MAG: hypothetical protein WD229_08575 [Pirellulales bacterium]